MSRQKLSQCHHVADIKSDGSIKMDGSVEMVVLEQYCSMETAFLQCFMLKYDRYRLLGRKIISGNAMM